MEINRTPVPLIRHPNGRLLADGVCGLCEREKGLAPLRLDGGIPISYDYPEDVGIGFPVAFRIRLVKVGSEKGLERTIGPGTWLLERPSDRVAALSPSPPAAARAKFSSA